MAVVKWVGYRVIAGRAGLDDSHRDQAVVAMRERFPFCVVVDYADNWIQINDAISTRWVLSVLVVQQQVAVFLA